MAEVLQAIRGMNDILTDEIAYWHFLEDILQRLAASYGYTEVRTPIMEKTELFLRSIGEITDIVEKEMYTFIDRNQESLTLRPEGTAGVVRAGIEHGLFHNQTQKFWYLGPIFRHERPQRGRYRQFHQFGMEAIGFPNPEIEAELILFNARLWREIGIMDQVELQINTLGKVATREKYRHILIDYFKTRYNELDNESQQRLTTNPLRILDSKNPKMQSLIADAPKLLDYLESESLQHFDHLQNLLNTASIDFVINPRLVRGLDYYTDTVFEWVTSALGAQGTVSAGGRYDNLIVQLGGQNTPAVGFAIGIERIIELLKSHKTINAASAQLLDIFVIAISKPALKIALTLTEKLRDALPNLKIMCNLIDGSFKSQFKKADKSGAKLALILGEDEVEKNTIGIKFLRENREQQTILQDKLNKYILEFFQNHE